MFLLQLPQYPDKNEDASQQNGAGEGCTTQ
jgi:hypothetical protein